MTHRERIEALLNGEKPDRLPLSFWRHFYDSESNAEQLKDAMVRFQQAFDWDLMKINPRASYHMEDWGNSYEYTGRPEDKPKRMEYAVHKSKDWEKIQRLDPNEAKALSEHLKAIKMIRDSVGDDLPIVMTVFNPISIAGDLVKDDPFLVDQIRKDPEPLHKALERITETFIDFSKAAIEAGADGLFFATTQWASTSRITEDEYNEFGRKYDFMLLDEVKPLTKINVMHVCNACNMLGVFKDYPIKIVNWDMNDKTNPDAEKGAEILPNKVVLGGVDRKGLLQKGTHAELEAMVEKYKAFAKKHPFMLGPDCSVPVTTPDENLRVIKSKIEH